jgi:hypothetical protein
MRIAARCGTAGNVLSVVRFARKDGGTQEMGRSQNITSAPTAGLTCEVKTMYDDLIKRLRREAVYLPEKFSKNAELLDVLMKAADAIEELSKPKEE